MAGLEKNDSVYSNFPHGHDFRSLMEIASKALGEGACDKAFAAVLAAAALSPMREDIAGLAMDVATHAADHGKVAVSQMVSMFLAARSEVLAMMLLDGHQIGSGSRCLGPDPSAFCHDDRKRHAQD